MSDRLVIKRKTSGRARFFLAAAALLGMLALWGLFEWGRKAGGHDRIQAAQERSELQAEIAELESANEDLERQLDKTMALLKELLVRISLECLERLEDQETPCPIDPNNPNFC